MFAKTACTSSALVELTDERNRLIWLGTTSVTAPQVLDWNERDGIATLVTSALPGAPASAVPSADAPAAARALVEFLDILHDLPIDECPFDRRLDVTLAAAAANTSAGLVDDQDFDEERQGRTADSLLSQLLTDRYRAQALEQSSLSVCHGDLCLPNVLLDPARLSVTGIVDVGRLGIADRHLDLALLTRSITSTALNPNYGPELATWVSQHTDADPWRIDYYRLLDELF